MRLSVGAIPAGECVSGEWCLGERAMRPCARPSYSGAASSKLVATLGGLASHCTPQSRQLAGLSAAQPRDPGVRCIVVVFIQGFWQLGKSGKLGVVQEYYNTRSYTGFFKL